MERTSRGSRAVAALLAAIGPVALLTAAALGVDRFRDAETRQAEANAGLVFNGGVRAGGAVAAMERILDREPRVVLIGPSYANTDLKRDVIAKALGIGVGEVAMLSVPNSVAAHWYTVLKYRVFDAGHRPDLVVVVSGLQSMLLTTPLTESSWVNLEAQLPDGGDPVVAARAQGNRLLALGRLREQRGRVRDALMGRLRDVPPRVLLDATGRPGGMGPLEVRSRLDTVFADENVSMALHTASTAIAVDQQVRDYDPEALPAPEDGFLGDITALAAEHQARIVWVRPPMSPQIPAELDDVVPRGFQARAVRVVSARGGTFLDMRRLPMTADMFKNEDHMNREGSTRFSEALGTALAELDALELEPVAGQVPPIPFRVGLVPEPGPVPEAVAADGDAGGTWIAPGSALVVDVGGGWARERGPFAVKVAAEQRGPEGVAPALRVDGKRVPLTASDADAWRLWRADALRPAPDGPFEVRIDVPEDGAWLRVVGLALGRRAGRQLVVGDDRGVDGVAARLLGVHREQQGRAVDASVRPVWLERPGGVPQATREIVDLPGTTAQFDTPFWGFMSDEMLMGQTAFGSRCSPLRVLEDGVPLPLPNVPCVEVQRFGRGRTCHTPDALLFTASDGSDPARNDRRYRMALAPERACDGAAWIYPRDTLFATWPAEQLAAFRRGATHLTLGARYLQKRATWLHVELHVDGAVRLSAEVEGRDTYAGPTVWVLDPPLPRDARDVTLLVENQDTTFYLVEEIALSEGPLPVQDRRWLALPQGEE